MTHSHERTLLAKLGFGDKDKQNPRHDLACQYLAQQPVFAKLLGPCLASRCSVKSATLNHEHHITKGQGQYKTTIGFADLYTRDCVLTKRVTAPERVLCPDLLSEEPEVADDSSSRFLSIEDIAAMRPRPAQHGLFSKAPLDAIKRRSERQRALTKRRQDAWLAWEADKLRAPMSEFLVFAGVAVLVEVKIERVSVGDILRQMRLYSEYLAADLGRVSRFHFTHPSVANTLRYRDCPRPTDESGYNLEACRCSSEHGTRLKYFGDPSTWIEHHTIVVTDFPLTADEVETLRSAGIAHAQFGAGLNAYVASQATGKIHASPRI